MFLRSLIRERGSIPTCLPFLNQRTSVSCSKTSGGSLVTRTCGPCSLKQMFTSAEFEGSLTNFQLLLEEGMFESSMLGVNSRILQHFQQLLNFIDLTSSGWMEQFLQLQNRSRRRGGSAEFNKVKITTPVPQIYEYIRMKKINALFSKDWTYISWWQVSSSDCVF